MCSQIMWGNGRCGVRTALRRMLGNRPWASIFWESECLPTFSLGIFVHV